MKWRHVCQSSVLFADACARTPEADYPVRPCAHGKLIEATLPNEACYPARPLDRTAAARGKPEHAMAARDLRCYCDRLGDITELPNICTARCTLTFTLKCDFHAEFICAGLVPANRHKPHLYRFQLDKQTCLSDDRLRGATWAQGELSLNPNPPHSVA